MPNLAVDVDSWARSACYPRSTFYPLSDGPPTWAAGSLEPAFAPARLVGLAVKPACTLALKGTVADRPERTFARLRYPLGGDRPSQTTRLARSPRRIAAGVRTPDGRGWYSKGGSPGGWRPAIKASHLSSTPDQRPMPSCSEGSRGLSVLPRVSRIFTTSAISPGPWSRQRPSRCAFRAGRNLPDKEFRYLRTVIVTAAVYRGLASELRLAADPSA